jgi:hypothetical protein
MASLHPGLTRAARWCAFAVQLERQPSDAQEELLGALDDPGDGTAARKLEDAAAA